MITFLIGYKPNRGLGINNSRKANFIKIAVGDGLSLSMLILYALATTYAL
jgi:hypothetical protein